MNDDWNFIIFFMPMFFIMLGLLGVDVYYALMISMFIYIPWMTILFLKYITE